MPSDKTGENVQFGDSTLVPYFQRVSSCGPRAPGAPPCTEATQRVRVTDPPSKNGQTWKKCSGVNRPRRTGSTGIEGPLQRLRRLFSKVDDHGGDRRRLGCPARERLGAEKGARLNTDGAVSMCKMGIRLRNIPIKTRVLSTFLRPAQRSVRMSDAAEYQSGPTVVRLSSALPKLG